MKKMSRRCSAWSLGALATGFVLGLTLIPSAPAQEGDPTGACCLPKSECVITTVGSCTSMDGVYQGDGTDCSECDTAPCCLLDGLCIDDLTQSECDALNGMWENGGTFCQEGSVVCVPFGACCLPDDGGCVFDFGDNCDQAGGYYFGDATDCAAVDCETVGACCLPSFGPSGTNCQFLPMDECASADGTFIGSGIGCGPSGCVGACCLPDRSCFEDTATECVAAGGVPQGLFTTCEQVSCLLFEIPIETPADGAALDGSGGELDGPAGADGATTGGRDVAVVEPGMGDGQVQVFVNEGADEGGTWLGFQAREPVTVGALPVDLVVAPLDGDAFADMAVANQGDDTVSILINAGDGLGNFNPIAPIDDPALDQPVAVAAADFVGGDGVIDLVVANLGTTDIAFFENDASASFTKVGDSMNLGAEPTAMDPIDLDNDKDPDIVIGGGPSLGDAGPGQNGQVLVLRRQSDGSYAAPISREVGVDPVSLATGDLDGNGFRDIVAANNGSDSLSIILNNGPTPNPEDQLDQAFSVAVGMDPKAVTVVDIDADGDNDLAVTVIDPTLG
ncbi:MAG: FG-GAP repeat domain-containing protein, partial [Planctomycetota bacterium]